MRALLTFLLLFSGVARANLCHEVQTQIGDAIVFDEAYTIAKSLSGTWHKTLLTGYKSYADHYSQVEAVLSEFGFTPYKDAQSNRLHVAARMHDAIEDAGVLKSEITAMFGVDVANLVDAVTQVKSWLRGDPEVEREALLQTYDKILSHPDGIYLKLADRIANMRSYHASGKSPQHYVDGYPLFKEKLYKAGQADAMWKELDRLITNSESLAKAAKK